jgi:hypothetical protein
VELGEFFIDLVQNVIPGILPGCDFVIDRVIDLRNLAIDLRV